MAKLNQIIAIEKGIKSRTVSEVTELYKLVQKPALFDGVKREYFPNDDAGEKLPPESKRVQMESSWVLKSAARNLSELFTITARKDYTNCVAKADVVVNGVTMITGAPVSFLLFLEKQLTDLRTLVTAIPTLDPAEDWKLDPTSGLFKSAETQTHRTKKVQRAIQLTPTTEQHPGTAQLITEDVIAGYWHQTKQSGAMPKPEKGAMLERIETLLQAVKQARETANEQDELPVADVASPIFSYLLGE